MCAQFYKVGVMLFILGNFFKPRKFSCISTALKNSMRTWFFWAGWQRPTIYSYGCQVSIKLFFPFEADLLTQLVTCDSLPGRLPECSELPVFYLLGGSLMAFTDRALEFGPGRVGDAGPCSPGGWWTPRCWVQVWQPCWCAARP